MGLMHIYVGLSGRLPTIIIVTINATNPIITSAKGGYVFVDVCLFVRKFARKLPNGFV